MGKTSKSINRLIIGAVIGTAILWAGRLSMSEKWRKFWRNVKSFFQDGMDEMNKTLKNKNKKDKKE
jgi:hypothetical protein